MENSNFQGSKWEEYEEFEFRWLEIALTKGVLSRKDLLHLADKYSIEFAVNNWRHSLDESEIGGVILNDVTKDKLFDFLKEYIVEKYPFVMSFEDLESIWSFLKDLDYEALVRFYLAVCRDQEARRIVKDKSDPKYFSNNLLALMTIEQLMKSAKEV